MRVLALDTSSLYGSAALVEDDRVLAELTTLGGLNRNEHVLPLIDHLLKQTGWRLEELDAFGVVRGPGSFMGLRIGLATMKGLSFAHRRPLYAMISLELLARGLPAMTRPICPVLDARKGEIYTGLYQWERDQLVCLEAPAALSPASWAACLPKNSVITGDGAAVLKAVLLPESSQAASDHPMDPNNPGFSFLSASTALPRASVLACEITRRQRAGGLELLTETTPLYLRASEAETKAAAHSARGA
ncbi:MAG: tRNA (adenosine(37)-N6)-threonylcarbamoyltransferase complex dimerization subunit type 1 TsaB [Myxococcota bacterium]